MKNSSLPNSVAGYQRIVVSHSWLKCFLSFLLFRQLSQSLILYHHTGRVLQYFSISIFALLRFGHSLIFRRAVCNAIPMCHSVSVRWLGVTSFKLCSYIMIIFTNLNSLLAIPTFIAILASLGLQAGAVVQCRSSNKGLYHDNGPH